MVEDLSISFGGVKALEGISFQVEPGSITSIIGPNGAGKTTLFNCISGIYHPDRGQIIYNGEQIQGKRPDQVAVLGVARTFQNIELFSMMTAMENLMLGRHIYMQTGLLRGALMWGKRSFAGREETANRRRVEEIIDFLDLHSARNQYVLNLPYGTRKTVELGRALALEPKLLLLDEPTAGMNMEEKQDMITWMQEIRDHLIDRARHEHDHGHFRQYRGSQFRSQDCCRPTWGGSTTPRGLERLPGGGGYSLLSVNNIETIYYGLLHALRGVSLNVKEGQIVTILGANGAGKSTLLKTIMGLLEDQPDKGTIKFQGELINGLDTERIVRQGISYVPEDREVFEELTVKENLLLGAYTVSNSSQVAQDLEKIFNHFPVLQERQKQWAGTLSGGEQQTLAISRAMMSRPKLLLLDEPSLGLSPLLVKEMFKIIKQINDLGTTIVLVEQNARMALALADFVMILENGRFVLEGSPEELAQDEDVKEFYLGVEKQDSIKGYKRYKRKKRWR